jgi:NAD(P)-dependent dehydrogenase (short-subunit alcohol dehydrogenase family)
MDEFSRKVAVITGAASGIGRGLARTAAREGMRVVLADIEATALEEAAAEVAALGVETLAVPTDVTDAAAVDALADAAFDSFGGAHLVCLNAGVFQAGVSWLRTEADWDWVLKVNLWGPIHGVRTFVPRLLEQGEPAHVVITSSMAGMMTVAYSAPYVVSKFGAAALAECVAHDLRAQGIEQVGVSCLVPGSVDTRIGWSERNRPASPVDSAGSVSAGSGSAEPPAASEAPSEATAADHVFVAEALREMTSTTGRPPDQAAEMVFAGIRAGDFWIPTTESYEALLGPRYDAVLRRELPTSAQFD